MASVESGVAATSSVTGQVTLSVRGQDYQGQPVTGLQGVAQGQDLTLLRIGRSYLAQPVAGYYAPRVEA